MAVPLLFAQICLEPLYSLYVVMSGIVYYPLATAMLCLFIISMCAFIYPFSFYKQVGPLDCINLALLDKKSSTSFYIKENLIFDQCVKWAMSKDAAEIELLIESIDEVLVSGTEDDNSPNSLAGLSIDQLLERCKFPEPPFGTCAHLEGFSEQSSMVMSDIVSEVAPEITQDITTPDGTQFYKPKKANGNETFHIAINTSSNEYVDSNNNEELKIECYYLSDVSRSPPAKKASMEHSAEYSNDATITSADIPFNKKLFSTIVRPRPRKPNLEQKEINRHTKIYIDNDCLLLLSI